ncbi:uncharacterized protein LOC120674234 isoform X2 [Panicum virgatum]|nr:uncharacterized protein LOC120674234 isoform X2 [Panicum virgatum]
MGGADDAAVRAEESISGGVVVWSDAVSSHDPDHLLVMVHAILGSARPAHQSALPQSELTKMRGDMCFLSSRPLASFMIVVEHA